MSNASEPEAGILYVVSYCTTGLPREFVIKRKYIELAMTPGRSNVSTTHQSNVVADDSIITQEERFRVSVNERSGR